MTTTRVIFAGSKATREWPYAKVIDMETNADHTVTLLHVSNRQKVSGLRAADSLSEAVGVALMVFQSGAAEAVSAIEDAVRAHDAERPLA